LVGTQIKAASKTSGIIIIATYAPNNCLTICPEVLSARHLAKKWFCPERMWSRRRCVWPGARRGWGPPADFLTRRPEV